MIQIYFYLHSDFTANRDFRGLSPKKIDKRRNMHKRKLWIATKTLVIIIHCFPWAIPLHAVPLKRVREFFESSGLILSVSEFWKQTASEERGKEKLVFFEQSQCTGFLSLDAAPRQMSIHRVFPLCKLLTRFRKPIRAHRVRHYAQRQW